MAFSPHSNKEASPVAREDLIHSLQEDNHYLELKLKYLQSVGTIFRQKVSMLIKHANQAGATREFPQFDSGDNDNNDGHHPIAALSEAMQAFDDAQASSPIKGTVPSLLVTERAEYWRERFLTAMSETRPSSLKEAQTLCSLLQEKNEMLERERQLRVQYEVLQNEYAKSQENYLRVLHDKSMTADAALKEVFKAKEAALVSMNPESFTAAAKEELEETRHRLTHAEQKNKVLRLRTAELRKQLTATEAAAAKAQADAAEQVATVTAQFHEVRARFAEREAESRRFEAARIEADRTVMLKDNTIVRLNSRITALEKEAQCALKEGLASVETNEVQVLQRQIDTFELHIRAMEANEEMLQKKIESLDEEIAKRDDTIQDLEIRMQAKDRVAETYRQRIEALKLEDEQRTHQSKLMEAFENKVADAVKEIHGMQNTRQLTERLAKLSEALEKIKTLEKTINDRDEQTAKLKAECEAFREEMARCVKFDRVPNLEQTEADVVKRALFAPETIAALKKKAAADAAASPKKADEKKDKKDDGGAEDETPPEDVIGPNPHLIGAAREVVLRTSGVWKEIRDTTSGRVFYQTTDHKSTPFQPKPVPKTPKTQTPASSAAATPAVQTPRDNKADASSAPPSNVQTPRDPTPKAADEPPKKAQDDPPTPRQPSSPNTTDVGGGGEGDAATPIRQQSSPVAKSSEQATPRPEDASPTPTMSRPPESEGGGGDSSSNASPTLGSPPAAYNTAADRSGDQQGAKSAMSDDSI